MLHTKSFYKELPCVNGFKWGGYDSDSKKHWFVKELRNKAETLHGCIYLLDCDIDTDDDLKNFKIMLEKGLTR